MGGRKTPTSRTQSGSMPVTMHSENTFGPQQNAGNFDSGGPLLEVRRCAFGSVVVKPRFCASLWSDFAMTCRSFGSPWQRRKPSAHIAWETCLLFSTSHKCSVQPAASPFRPTTRARAEMPIPDILFHTEPQRGANPLPHGTRSNKSTAPAPLTHTHTIDGSLRPVLSIPATPTLPGNRDVSLTEPHLK